MLVSDESSVRKMIKEQTERQTRINQRFQGKTIDRIECEVCNTWTIHFTDGTKEQLWAESAVSTTLGSIPGIFLADELK
jgi:hypothetical protein